MSASTANSEIGRLDAVTLARRIRARELSAVEVTEAALARMEATEPHLHAFCTPAPELAREAARTVERRIMAGEDIGPLQPVEPRDDIRRQQRRVGRLGRGRRHPVRHRQRRRRLGAHPVRALRAGRRQGVHGPRAAVSRLPRRALARRVELGEPGAYRADEPDRGGRCPHAGRDRRP